MGSSFIAVGIHTGTVVVFEVASDEEGFVCRIADSQRSHHHPVTDLASTTVAGASATSSSSSSPKDVMVSADETGVMNVWGLGTTPAADGIAHKARIDSHADGAVTAMALWNKIGQGTRREHSASFVLRDLFS